MRLQNPTHNYSSNPASKRVLPNKRYLLVSFLSLSRSLCNVNPGLFEATGSFPFRYTQVVYDVDPMADDAVTDEADREALMADAVVKLAAGKENPTDLGCLGYPTMLSIEATSDFVA